MFTAVHGEEGEEWCSIAVHPFLKDVFKQSLGNWARWDSTQKVWWVKSQEVANLDHLRCVLDAVALDPGQVWRKAKQGTPLRVSLASPLNHDTSERQRLASSAVVALDAYREAVEEDDADIPWQWGDRVPIRATAVDTGYGVLRGIGPDDTQSHGNAAQYLLTYTPHEAPEGLGQQFVAIRGSAEWRELLALARRGEALILAALDDTSEGRDGRVLRVKPEDSPLPFAELFLERRRRKLPGAAAVGLQLPQQPALGHSAGLFSMSLIYCPAGAEEVAALVRGMAQLDMEAEDAVTLLHSDPASWLASRRDVREVLERAPLIFDGREILGYQRASYAQLSAWVERIMESLPERPL